MRDTSEPVLKRYDDLLRARTPLTRINAAAEPGAAVRGPGQLAGRPLSSGALARRGAMACLLSLAWLAGCGGPKTHDDGQTQPIPTPTPMACTEGDACSCPAGQAGTLSCDGGTRLCTCKQCAPLEVHDVAKVDACGGDVFGTWLLTRLEIGRGGLEVSVAGEARGSCDLMLDTPAQLPHELMLIEDGGDVEYAIEEVPTKAHWSDSCVTSKASTLSCGADAWTGVSNCAIDCDTCTCDTHLGNPTGNDYEWTRTDTTLSLSPFGKVATFDYCVKDGVLTLSADGLLLEYNQVFTIDTPSACETRSTAECALGTGCSLGACEGSDACLPLQSQSSCLTRQGCSWNGKVCSGLAEHCALADYGNVPGCVFADTLRSCVGTPSGCDAFSADACATVTGCSVSQVGRCTGPTLPCENFFACPSGYCTDAGSACSGISSCAAFEADFQCDEANANFPNAPCTWEAMFCEGTPEPCSSYDQTRCGQIPGCKLGTPPCAVGSCEKTDVELGGTCKADAWCKSGSCVAGVCRGTAKPGANCQVDSDCAQRSVCCPDGGEFPITTCSATGSGCLHGIGDSCDLSTCWVGKCYGELLCSKTCTVDADCGPSPWGGTTMCRKNGEGANICFPTCASSTDCGDSSIFFDCYAGVCSGDSPATQPQ